MSEVHTRTAVLAGLLASLVLLASASSAQTRESFEIWFRNQPVRDKNDELYRAYFTKADSCMGKYLFEESNRYCELALKYRPEDHLVRAMECLNYYEIAEPLDPKKSADRRKKLEIYRTMVRIAEDGIRVAPDRSECHFMRGLANARIATTKGILASLFMGRQMVSDWLKGLSRNSEYVTPNGENLVASCYITLASFYRLCPDNVLLKWFFGIRGDLDRSVECARNAYERDRTRIEIVKEYGISLVTRGLKRKNPADIEEGKKYLTMVEALPLRLRTDGIDKVHSRMLLSDINLCPQYSRDQQQEEVSERAARQLVRAKAEGRAGQ